MMNGKADERCPQDSNDPLDVNAPLTEEATRLLCEHASSGQQVRSYKIIPNTVRFRMCSPAGKKHRRKQPF